MSGFSNNTHSRSWSITEQGYTGIGTYHVISSSPFTAQDLAEASDTDAPADEWGEEEYDRQMLVMLMKHYEEKTLMDLRKICKARKLRVRGNKVDLIERLARDDVQKMYHGGSEQQDQQ